MSAWQTEFKTQLVAKLCGDATLTALLASSDAVFFRRPDQAAAFPCVVCDLKAEDDPAPCKPGKRIVRLKLSALADDPDTLDAIEDALRTLLDDRPAQLTTANWQCGRCRLVKSTQEDASAHDPDTKEPLTRITSEWEVWLYAK